MSELPASVRVEMSPPGLAPGEMSPAFATPDLALAAAPPRRRRNWARGLLLTGVVALIAICGVLVLGIIGWTGGPVALAVGTVSALVPVPFLVFCFLWLDRYQPEPAKYLAFCFAWGACVATAVALLVNSGAAEVFKSFGWSESLVAVIIAPIIEESMKAAGPLLLFWRRRKTFSGMIDAIVYCGLSATGFAMVENILYLGVKAYAEGADEAGPVGGATQVILVFIARILLTGFAHPLFTSMTALGIGLAVRASSRVRRFGAPLLGLGLAMVLHGSWNLMSVTAPSAPYVLLYGYFAVMVPIFLGMVGFTLWLRSSEGRLAERILPDYARAGWLSPPEVAALGTLRSRLSARRWARRVAGDPGAKAMKAFQFEAARLALLRDRVRRGHGLGPAQAAATFAEERTLLEAMMAYRRVFAGRDPQAPRALWDGVRYHVTFPDGAVRAVDPPELPVAPVAIVLPPSILYAQPGPPGYHPAPGPPGYHPAPGPPGYHPAPGPPGYHPYR